MPMTIPEKEKIIVRGEAVISYQNFEEINKSLPEGILTRIQEILQAVASVSLIPKMRREIRAF